MLSLRVSHEGREEGEREGEYDEECSRNRCARSDGAAIKPHPLLSHVLPRQADPALHMPFAATASFAPAVKQAQGWEEGGGRGGEELWQLSEKHDDRRSACVCPNTFMSWKGNECRRARDVPTRRTFAEPDCGGAAGALRVAGNIPQALHARLFEGLGAADGFGDGDGDYLGLVFFRIVLCVELDVQRAAKAPQRIFDGPAIFSAEVPVPPACHTLWNTWLPPHGPLSPKMCFSQ